jgi:hypothetical protein
MNAAAWGVIGAIVGALASIATTWLTNRHTAALQRKQASEERKERHRDFQRENLIALQDTMHEYLRMISMAYFEDLKAFAGGADWGRTLISKEVSDGCMLTARRAVILMERIENDELRLNLKTLHKSLGEITMMHSKDEAEAKLAQATKQTVQVLEDLGTELRRQY